MKENPFSLTTKNKLKINDSIFNKLTKDEMLIYFIKFLDSKFTNRDKRLEKDYDTCIGMIKKELNKKDSIHKMVFLETFDMVYLTLS